jgi:hypothetical protein
MAATTDDDHNGVSNETEAVLRENNFKTASSSGGGGGSGWATTGTTTLTGDTTIDQDSNELSFTENVNIPTINGVKVYRALLTQIGTDAPVATVLENTLGGLPVWSRTGTGEYKCLLNGVFTVDKTMFFVAPLANGNTGGFAIDGLINTVNAVYITTVNYDNINNDTMLDKTPIEILVYP